MNANTTATDFPLKAGRDELNHYSLLLRPHRSLSARAFFILMGFICTVSFVMGVFFASLGAWPIFGFFGLDVLLIYIAFKQNFKSGKCCEVIEIRGGKLILNQINTKGDTRRKLMDSYWSKVQFKDKRLSIHCRGNNYEFGRFLIPDEKEAVFLDLKDALQRSQNPNFA
jgi:uncharacterized membrane protein